MTTASVKTGMTDFSSLINPLGPPAGVIERLGELSGDLTLPWDPQAERLRSELARRFPLWPENVAVSQGWQSLIIAALRILAPRRVLLVEPCLPEYRRLLNLHHAEILSVHLDEKEDFRFSLPKLINGLGNVQMVLFGTPQNPTGSALSREDLKTVLSEARRRDVYTLIDESHGEWCPELSVGGEVKDNSYFLAFRSMAPFYGCVGLRCAFALGARKMIEKMMVRQENPGCDRLSESLFIRALQDAAFAEKSRGWLEEERGWFRRALEATGLCRVFGDQGPGLLVKMNYRLKAGQACQVLENKGIRVKAMSEFAGIDDAFFRVGVRQRKDNEAFLKIFKQLDSL